MIEFLTQLDAFTGFWCPIAALIIIVLLPKDF